MNSWALWDRLIYDDDHPSGLYRMDRHTGLCHLCVTENKKGAAPRRPITYCSWCKHWFCAEHRSVWFVPERGYEALMQVVGGRRLGCCGPRGE